jgi:hypothetical protein
MSNNGDDASSRRDGASPEASAPSGAAAGEAGAAMFCNQVCAGLLACAAGADAGPCHCDPGSSAIERADYVASLTTCVKNAIIADCSDAGAAVQGCEVSAAVAITPTTSAANFCKNLELTHCSQILPDCLSNAGIYGDTTIATFANCFAELPDADVDGGCVPFGTCLGNASQ